MSNISNQVVLILAVSLVVIFSPFFAKIFKLPTTPIEIIFGAILGYVGFIQQEHLFDIVAKFGFLYLMFIAGTEINLKKVLKTPMKLMQMISLYLLLLYGSAIAFSLYFSLGKIFMVLLPLISVGLIATLSKEYGKTPWLVLSMIAGGIGEVISIAALTLVSATLEFGGGVGLFQTILALILFLLFMVLLFRSLQLLFWWFPEVSVILMPHDDNKEQDIRLSMGIFFILLAVMLYLHLELAFGAFLAGIFIPTFFDHKDGLPEKLSSYGFGFLIPIFFIHIGSTFKFEALFMNGLIVQALVITFIMIAMRLVSSLVFIKEVGFKHSILMGLSHSMPLSLLIAMATLAYTSKGIDEFNYFALILAALFQVLFVMLIIKIINLKVKEKVTA
jgi:Kef-type K+ transport system membrane component KefB